MKYSQPTVAGFCGILSCYVQTFADRRESRTVILPDFQGLGLGSRMCDAICELFSIKGISMMSKTAHQRYGLYRDKSCLWKSLPGNHELDYDHTEMQRLRKLKLKKQNSQIEINSNTEYLNESDTSISSQSSDQTIEYQNKNGIMVKTTREKTGMLRKHFFKHAYIMRNKRKTKKQFDKITSRMIIYHLNEIDD